MIHKQLLNKTAITLGMITALICGAIEPSRSQAKNPTTSPVSRTEGANRPLYSLRAHIWDVSNLTFSPNGQILVSGGLDETIQVWSLLTHKRIRSFPGHKDGVNAVIITPDGKTLASAGGTSKPNTDKTIRITNLRNAKVIRTLNGHTLGIKSLAISPDGQILASGSYDKTIKLWDIKTGKLINTLNGHTSWVRALAISPSGKTLISGGGSPGASNDTTIRVWDLQTGKLLRNIPNDTEYISFIAFTPNGENIISGSETAIKIWDANSGKLTNTINAPSPEGIKAIAISPNGATLATTSLDASVRLWSLADGKLLQTLVPPANNQNLDRPYPSSVRFSPNGKTIAIGHGGGAYLSQFPIDVREIK